MAVNLGTRSRNLARWLLAIGLVLVVLLGVMVIAFSLLFPGPTAGQIAAQEAGDRLTTRIERLKDGELVDLASALDVGWERALVMEAYMPGDQMNEVLGFNWYRDDDWAGADESQRTLAFVSGRTVVAEVLLSPESFRIDEAVEAIDAANAVFVAGRRAGIVWLFLP